jgi:hypothetical protein
MYNKYSIPIKLQDIEIDTTDRKKNKEITY